MVSGLDDDDSTDYEKVAKAVGNIKAMGINVSLIDINKSDYMFEPDEQNNTILYGMKSLNGVNGDSIRDIIEHRPYKSFSDFLDKTSLSKTAIMSLIKGGAFNEFGAPRDIMIEYIMSTSGQKKRITMQNVGGLIEHNLLPKSLTFQRKVFNFNKYMRSKCKYDKDYWAIDKDDICYRFYMKYFDKDMVETYKNHICVSKVAMKRQYDDFMEPVKSFVNENKDMLLDSLNDALFNDEWNKYASGSLSHWEMEALGMYYHKHELSDIDESLYGIVHFKELSPTPVVDKTFHSKGRSFSTYKLCRICGTVIAKDDVRSSIAILTKESGVVTCKMTKEYYARYNRRIAYPNGKIAEDGWFKRGTLVLLNGYRRGDTFVLKRYRKTPSHQLYKICSVNDDGSMSMTNCRYGDEQE